ncbi:MAG: poly-beta-1,6 N-acetyl-D-glucosamine synthase [Alphaproteobacteria bacterium]|nr:poly-beta-1,6 N-acetyl-D-glucosamine synthase [Alphaproteobacteria bacterium]
MDSFLASITITLIVAAATAGSVLLSFVFLYPFFMSFLWITGGVYYWWHWERKMPRPDDVPPLPPDPPLVSILVPCFNEGDNVDDTIESLLGQSYPNFEIIAVNDGSRDDTRERLDRLAAAHPRLRVVHFAANQGKAMALNMATLAAKGEYLVCLDGDAILHPHCVSWMVLPLLQHPRVGAVTGNPRIRTRSTVLGRVQVGEFSSIIGLIKRAQRSYGRIYTVSGVIAAFRKSALHRIGYWVTNMITEDIDVSWRLQCDAWAIHYQPTALCWILMPETLGGLWRQRVRWAQGGTEVFLRYIRSIWRWRLRRMWPLLIEFSLSTAWAFALALAFFLWALGKFVDMPEGLNVPTIFPPAFWGLMLAAVCILQFVTALLIERRYESGLLRELPWIIWYPLAFWLLSALTALAGFFKAILRRRNTRAVWVSPDRGVRTFVKH